MKGLAFLVAVSLISITQAHADPACGVVEVRFEPGAKNLQIVVWIEDTNGVVLATPYVTRVTGQFGVANRPGTPLLHTAFGWPYGRREMIFPVWAHRRNHHYPKVVMGGACGNNIYGSCPGRSCDPSTCDVKVAEQGGPCCCGDCEDDTIAYHFSVSSTEPFFCPPDSAPDAVSCASQFNGSKGAYATDGSYSLYPPRADLIHFDTAHDGPDAMDFAKQNDLVAVSAATPPANLPLLPAIEWYPGVLLPGDYVAWIEISQESDWTPGHGDSRDPTNSTCVQTGTNCYVPDHPCQTDFQVQWNNEGHDFLGQPSVVWKVPFHYDGNGRSAIAADYSGYGDWDGATGMLHPPDGTIMTGKDGSGAGRLLAYNDGTDVYRAKVVVGNCGGMLPDGGVFAPGMDGGTTPPNCAAPDPVENLTLVPDQTSIAVQFTAPTTGSPANRFSVRYRGGSMPITDADFDSATAAPSVVADPGASVSATITPLERLQPYTVAVRGVSPCGAASPVVSASTETLKPKYVTLSGCFIATAAYGSPLEKHVVDFRAFRDHHLLTNPAGRLATAVYYAFSPPLAGVIAANDGLRTLARRALAPIASLVQ
jgi:hypothetical protein